jgi:hypothetical protein
MEIQTKVFNVPDQENHVLMLARGVLDARGVEQILNEAAVMVFRQPNCNLLIDLIDAECKIDFDEIERLFPPDRQDVWPRNCKIALVSSPRQDDFNQLATLNTFLSTSGRRTAVFRDAKSALAWLAESV